MKTCAHGNRAGGRELPAAAGNLAESDSQLVRLGLVNRKIGRPGKYGASNDHHLRQIISRLEEAGDVEAANTIIWLVWWKEHYSSRFYAADRKLLDIEMARAPGGSKASAPASAEPVNPTSSEAVNPNPGNLEKGATK